MISRRGFLGQCFSACVVGVALAYGKLPPKPEQSYWTPTLTNGYACTCVHYANTLTKEGLENFRKKLERDMWGHPDMIAVHPKQLQSIKELFNA